VIAAAGPVIPQFGRASRCVEDNRWFCTDWVRQNWHSVLEPRLVQHLELTAIAVGIGFPIAFALALVAYRRRYLTGAIGAASDFLYTIPSAALFQLLVPVTGLTWTTIEIALVSYTLLILFRNTLVGLHDVPEDVKEASRGMGLTRVQTLVRVEIPLALPAIVAGLRIAVVSTISIGTIAAFLLPKGLGYPIFVALGNPTPFKTEIYSAGGLAVGLALLCDAGLVVLRRALAPWARLVRA
jgi:osmoprotectant transport system permease protein